MKLRAMGAVIAVIAAVTLGGCGGGLSSGIVRQKIDVPAHDETGVMPMYTGQSCYGSGSSRYCHSNYIYVPYVYYVPEKFELVLRDCRQKDGSIDQQHCKTGTAYVDQETYRSTRVGSYYHRTSGDATPPQRKPLHKVNK